jgi:hypothetical protein
MGKKNNSYTALYKLKELENIKSDSREFRGPKAAKSAYLKHPDFSAKLKKLCKLHE